MKTIIGMSLLAFFSLSLIVACGGSSGPSCEDVCNKMVECNMESNLTECQTQCTLFKDALRDEVYAELGDCYMASTCDELIQGEDMCFDQAMLKGSATAATGLIQDMCDKFVECEEGWLMEDCMSETGLLRQDSLDAIGMFKDSVVDCMGTCVAGLTCDEILGEDDQAMDDCSESCNLMIF